VSSGRTLLDRLAGLQLLVVTGKGGVGKSTLTVTLGRALAAVGRQVLLLEVDPRESLYPLLDVPPSGGDLVDTGGGLSVQNLQPRAVLDDLVRDRLWSGLLARRVLASSIYEHFVEGAPGLKELAVLGAALQRVTEGGDEPQFDTVVLDAPASGHALSLLTAPLLVADVIRDGPFGELAGRLAEFVADTERCGVVLATLAEEMPVQETVELLEAVERRLRRRPEAVMRRGCGR
jgi:anion-transporting  ArsA/GET3 family ATPase